MPSPENKNRQKDSPAENDKSFKGNEEQQLDSNAQSDGSSNKQDETDQNAYRSRNLEIEKERD